MYVGSKIKQLRQSLDLTQTEFARELSVSQPYYSAIESGKKPISNKMIEFIFSKWGIEKEYFRTKIASEIDAFLGVIKGGNNGGVDYLSDEKKLMSKIDANVKMILFLYQRIVDIRILLNEQLDINDQADYGGKEADMMNELIGVDIRHTHTGDSIVGYKHDAEDFKGKLVINSRLEDCIEHFQNVFFKEFRTLYLGLRKMDETGRKKKSLKHTNKGIDKD